MSLASLWQFLWRHIPSEETMQSVGRLAKAAEAFIAILQAELPEIEGKTEAIDAAKSALVHGNLVLAKAAQDDAVKASAP